MSQSTTSRSTELGQGSEWIAGLRAGKLEVFQAIFHAYATRLRYFAGVWLPHDVSEDIVQEVLFDIWRRRTGIQIQNHNLTAYLFSAVRNRVVTHLRHEGVKARLLSGEMGDDAPGMGAAPAAPDEQMVAQEFSSALTVAMTQLSELQRAVLMLRWTERMSYADIGAALSISENAARHHVSRARQVLRPLMRGFVGDVR